MTRDIAGLNLILGLIGFSWLLWRSSHRWAEYPSEIRLVLSMTLALFFCLLAVSSEILISDENLVKSIVAIFLTKVFALYVLARTHGTKYRTGNRRLGGGPQPGNVDKDVPERS